MSEPSKWRFADILPRADRTADVIPMPQRPATDWNDLAAQIVHANNRRVTAEAEMHRAERDLEDRRGVLIAHEHELKELQAKWCEMSKTMGVHLRPMTPPEGESHG